MASREGVERTRATATGRSRAQKRGLRPATESATQSAHVSAAMTVVPSRIFSEISGSFM